MFVPKIIRVGGNLTKLWQKTILRGFFETRCTNCHVADDYNNGTMKRQWKRKLQYCYGAPGQNGNRS